MRGRWLIFVLAALLSHCSQNARTDDRRGGLTKALNEAQGNSGDAQGEEGAFDPEQQAPVIKDEASLAPINFPAEVDVSALPAGFLEDVQMISKISPSKTLLYSKSGHSWLLDESQAGVLTKIQTSVTVPAGAKIFPHEADKFWLFSTETIAFPASQAPESLGQVTLLNITPELLKDPQHKLLYVGSDTLILTNASKANVVSRSGDNVRYLYLDLPKSNGQAAVVTAAGIGDGADLYWFLTSEQILLLSRSNSGSWQWRTQPFKLDLPPDVGPNHLALMVGVSNDKDVSLRGRTLVSHSGKLFDRDPLKLSVLDEKAAAIQQVFLTQVQVLLTNNCAGCHPGYDQMQTAKDKAGAFKMHLMNQTMPPNQPLSAADTKTILDWYASIPL